MITAAWRGTFGVLSGADHFTAVAPLADPSSDLVAAILADMDTPAASVDGGAAPER